MTRWRDWEVRYLKQHREDGAASIADALGRTEASVWSKARALRVDLTFKPLEVCVLCGTYPVRPSTAAGRAGVCLVCYKKRKRSDLSEAAACQALDREYDAAKHVAARRRKA